MSGANKILTVSYGTFSCTIEGFEDPFGTMKQIAEYFRDLAAEDRYFGAEPPVPDAEALRHLAEHEAARRVEARMGANGVHLRQLDDAAAAASATPVMSPAQPVAPPDAAPFVATATAAVAAAAASEVLTPSEVIDPEPESVAARLSRIRAVVARARSTLVWPEDVSDVADAEVGADAAAAAAPATAPTPAPAPASAPPVVTMSVVEAEPEVALAPEKTASDDGHAPAALAETEDEVEVRAHEDDDAVAAGQHADTGDAAETWAANDLAAVEADAALQNRAADVPMDPASDDFETAISHAVDLDEAAPSEKDLSPWNAADDMALVPDAAAFAAEGSDDVASDGVPGRDAPGAYADVADTPAARIVALRKADYAAADATEQLDDLLAGRIDPQDVHARADAPLDTADDAADERTASLLAAIRAVGVTEQRADVEAEAAEAFDPAEVVDARDDADEAAEPDATHAWQVDAEPASETFDYASIASPPLRLDDALRVAPDDAGDAEDLDRDADAAAGSDDSPHLLSAALSDNDHAADPARDDQVDNTGSDTGVDEFDRMPGEASVDRLLAETNSQLESTEMNRRRSAIAHLKAAVAAARADKDTHQAAPRSQDSGIGPAIDKFREDLARVVRPRRPVDDGLPRPVRRMPPLMLVSEQRVDVTDAPARSHDAVAGTVRPRRVTTREVASDEGEDVALRGFADFAESMGARDLPDMLEAAAAYTAFVEGRPSFSRPQLMQMVRGPEGIDDEFSREEQLRSFGLLLRQGRIQKLKRGQFTVADDTRFRPERRHAGE